MKRQSPHRLRRSIERAIAIAGGTETRLATITGYSQVSINKAKRLGQCGPLLAIAIHHATQGLVPASELRPDLWTAPENVPAKQQS